MIERPIFRYLSDENRLVSTGRKADSKSASCPVLNLTHANLAAAAALIPANAAAFTESEGCVD